MLKSMGSDGLCRAHLGRGCTQQEFPEVPPAVLRFQGTAVSVAVTLYLIIAVGKKEDQVAFKNVSGGGVRGVGTGRWKLSVLSA